ncbi:DUF5405 family protein [Schnuerera sp.]|uniref:DUF5405 family protein n=1 Tax=Schnuerera sp. TaxID=2794844 RepID=UPI002B94106E|nr:DUF5405 family protein [Schnuerera sp.]HSH36210.1 DUF5405 family protein [Schnuerera sp.]
MKISVDNKHQIVSDSMQYILQGKKTVREGKKEGEEYWVNVGYYSKIYNALQGYKELQIKNSNVTTIDELMKLIKNLDNKIEQLLKGN